MAAYAAATATTASYDSLRDAASAGAANKPAKSTTIRYQDTLGADLDIGPAAGLEPLAQPPETTDAGTQAPPGRPGAGRGP